MSTWFQVKAVLGAKVISPSEDDVERFHRMTDAVFDGGPDEVDMFGDLPSSDTSWWVYTDLHIVSDYNGQYGGVFLDPPTEAQIKEIEAIAHRLGVSISPPGWYVVAHKS